MKAIPLWTRRRLAWIVCLAACLAWTAPALAASRMSVGPAPGPRPAVSGPGPAAQAPGVAQDPGREVMLQTIGMLAGQGLWLGREALAGLAGRAEKRLVDREQAGRSLADMTRYIDVTLAVFKDRLMGRLAPEERRDLTLLIGYYETFREAATSLAAYLGGEAGGRAAYETAMERLGAALNQISLGGRPAP